MLLLMLVKISTMPVVYLWVYISKIKVGCSGVSNIMRARSRVI